MTVSRTALLLGLLALAACASPEMTGQESMPAAAESAACTGDPVATLKVLEGATESPAVLLLRAHAQEASGKIMAARPLFAKAAKEGRGKPISLACDGKALFAGDIGALAQERLEDANARLAALGATDRQVASMDLPPAAQECRYCRPPLASIPPAPPAPEPAAKPAPAAAPKVKQAFWAQLTAYKSTKRAEAGWEALKRKHAKLLQGCKPAILEADLGGDKGKVVRLGCDGFASAKEATAFCAKMAAAKEWCQPRAHDPVKPAGKRKTGGKAG